MIDRSMQTAPVTAEDDMHGLSLLAAATAAEVFASASAAQARGFYAAIGRRMAHYIDLDGASEIEALTERMNRLWTAFGWGAVRLEMGEDAVLVHHYGMPRDMDGDLEGLWPQAAAALLEGAYDLWFRSLAGDGALRTKFVGWRGDVAELRHGR
jgi:hypothetical protein